MGSLLDIMDSQDSNY